MPSLLSGSHEWGMEIFPFRHRRPVAKNADGINAKHEVLLAQSQRHGAHVNLLQIPVNLEHAGTGRMNFLTFAGTGRRISEFV